MSKIQVIMKSKYEGCDYYRLWLPHKDWCTIHEGMQFPDELNCDIAVFHHKSWNMDRLRHFKKQGIKIVIDFDDWIEVPEDHIFYTEYNQNRETMIEQLRLADLVICTTDILRNELLPFNRNVEIIPNSLNESELVIEPKKERYVTFGYAGGMCHLPDVQELEGTTRRLQVDPSTMNRYYIAIMGYWDRNMETDDIRRAYLDILSNKRRYLKLIKLYPKVTAMDYLRLYNFFDISLIPLKDNLFNRCKSPVKLVESGFYRKGVICQDFEPYSRILTEKNSLKVGNRFQWYKQMKYAIHNPEAMKDKAGRLYEYVKEKFDLVKWTAYRKELYNSLK